MIADCPMNRPMAADAPVEEGVEKPGASKQLPASVPLSLPEFGSKQHWDDEYDKEDEPYYDWVLGYAEIGHLLDALLGREPGKKILHLGSGNSSLPENLYCAGYRDQVVTDISGKCMRLMQERSAEKNIHEIRYEYGDACDLLKTEEADLQVNPPRKLEMLGVAAPDGSAGSVLSAEVDDDEEELARRRRLFQNDHYDLVFEKSTLDAMLCDDGDHAVKIVLLLREAWRSMKSKTGIFLCVSMHPPGQVEMYFRLPCWGWRFRHVAIEDVNCRGDRKNYHYAYICSHLKDRGCMEREWDGVWEKILSRPDLDPLRAWMRREEGNEFQEG